MCCVLAFNIIFMPRRLIGVRSIMFLDYLAIVHLMHVSCQFTLYLLNEWMYFI